jgi:hypothetical protein
MSTPTNHHFVPQVYLKEFSNFQKQFYQLIKGYANISIKSIAQVCYKTNYFKLKQEDNLFVLKFKDKNYIEKNVFKKQENGYPKLLKKLTFSSILIPVLTRSEARLLLEIILTIKRRNPSSRKQLIEDYKQYITSEEFKKAVAPGIEIGKKLDSIDPEVYFEKFIKNIKTNEDKQGDIYLERFVDEEDNIIPDLANFLLKYKIFIYHAPAGTEFITSDNPGFTMFPNGNLLSSGGFAHPFTYLFPLTPKCCFYISHQFLESNKLAFTKEVEIKKADQNFVNSVNEGTYKIANERVFSLSKSTIEKPGLWTQSS